MKKIAPWYVIISTWFGIGYSKMAPGTVGSLATLPFVYVLHVTYGWQAVALFAATAFLVGTIATEYYIKKRATNLDPKEVVIDEVVGQSIALLFVTPGIYGYVVGFVLFRLFDVIKPWPVSFADKKIKGALGVMLDDVLAGFLALLLPLVCYLFLVDYMGMAQFNPYFNELNNPYTVSDHVSIGTYEDCHGASGKLESESAND